MLAAGGVGVMAEQRRHVGRTRVATVKGDPRGSIPERVQWLFETLVVPGRGPFTAAEVARWVDDAGGSISAVYVLKILRGERTKPSLDKLQWIAKFFGIQTAWLVDENPPELDVDALITQLQLRQIRVDPQRLLTKIAELSPATQLALSDIIDNLLRAEGKKPAT